MDDKTKILDVTYGNFSCRLEGFDDSVETMKTVVSFFHDLAGHNRFMDVAPQAPDMSTLARLTEEQTGVAVQAESDGSHVSLRAVRDDEDEVAEQVAAEDVDEANIRDDTTEELHDQPDAEEDDATVADKLDRIREVVDRDATTEEFDDAISLDTPTEAPVADEAPQSTGVNPLAQRLADLAKRSSQTRILNASNAYVETPKPVSQDETPDAAEATDIDAVEADDDGMPEAEEDVLTEDIAEDVFDAAAEFDEDSVHPVEQEDTLADVEDALDELTQSDDATEDVFETAQGDLAEEDTTEPDAVEQATDALLLTPEEAVEASDEDLDEYEATAAEPADAIGSEDTTEVAAERPKSTTLVLKPSDAADPMDDLPEGIDRDKVENATDDDFDLATEVALVEAEIARRESNKAARHGLSRRVEDAMSRIMSQTDQHLAKPESRRHRDAFAQLKAAVAATEAARQLGDQGEKAPDPDELFKDDLDAHANKAEVPNVVTPPSDVLKPITSKNVKPIETRRVEPASNANAEPAPRPAIKPVASKNVKPLDAASERLRQIQSKKESEGGAETTGFAEFAASHGATELVDMLEAAGAYICFVEGEADFSRPQVMKVVQTASEKEISREDGLRCFGRLLRQSRIEKLPNGRFQVAEGSQYRPDDEHAAQA